MTERQRQPVVLDTAWIIEGPDGSASVRKADSASQQLSEDPFSYGTGAGPMGGLAKPLYDLDQLLATSEGNSLHGRCCRQKATDVLGRGIVLRGRESDTEPPPQEEDRWGEFVRQVEEDERGDGSLKERLTWAHEDFEAVGWAVIEVGRRTDGSLDGLWYVPAHTVRAHVDGRRYAQQRNGKTVWFKRFGTKGSVSADNGSWSDRDAVGAGLGNELIVIRNHTPRSSWYGAPDHIPALAAIAGWKAQAEFNLRFFDNVAVPSYAVVIEGATLTPDLEEMILEHFKRIKGDPARTIVIPIPANPDTDQALQPKLRFEQLSSDVKDATHRLYRQDNALEILISHGMPPYRVGWPIIGSLGGNVAREMSEVYKSSVVQVRQETWEQRLDRALLGAKGLGISGWQLKCAELDLRDMAADVSMAKGLYELGVVTPNDLARFFGYDPRPDEVPGGDDYIALPLAPGGRTGATPEGVVTEDVAKAWTAEVRELSSIRKRLYEITEAVAA